MLKDWNWRTPITDILNLEENNYACKKHYLWRKKRFKKLRYEVFTRCEKWREPKNNEAANSLYKNWEKSRETIQGLTSQMQEVQEQMNSINDSGGISRSGIESQWEPSQPAAIPSSRSMLSRDKRLPLDTWNTSGPWENVSGNQFATVDFVPTSLSKNSSFYDTRCYRIGSSAYWYRDSCRKGWRCKYGTIPMPTFARRPSTKSSLFPVDIPQNSMVGQQRQQISELQFCKFPTPQSFLCWKMRWDSKTKWLLVLSFHLSLCCGSKKYRWPILWRIWNPRDQLLERIFQILRCWMQEFLLLWVRSSRIPTSRRRSASKNRKPKKRTRFYEEERSPSWSAAAFELLALMIPYKITPIYSLSLFAMMIQVSRGPGSYKKVGLCFCRRRLRRPSRRLSNSVSIVVGVLVAMVL